MRALDPTRCTVDSDDRERWDGDLLPTINEHWAACFLAENVQGKRDEAACMAQRERQKRERAARG